MAVEVLQELLVLAAAEEEVVRVVRALQILVEVEVEVRVYQQRVMQAVVLQLEEAEVELDDFLAQAILEVAVAEVAVMLRVELVLVAHQVSMKLAQVPKEEVEEEVKEQQQQPVQVNCFVRAVEAALVHLLLF